MISRRVHYPETTEADSPNIPRVIKSRLRWVGHIARMEEGRDAFKILTVSLQERDLQEGLFGDGRTILEWI